MDLRNLISFSRMGERLVSPTSSDLPTSREPFRPRSGVEVRLITVVEVVLVVEVVIEVVCESVEDAEARVEAIDEDAAKEVRAIDDTASFFFSPF